MVDRKEAINNINWWLLLPKPEGLLQLKNKNIAFHALKQISVYPSFDGTHCSSLIVNFKNPIYSLADLKNHTILVSSYHSTSTYMYPHYLLKDFFKENHIKLIPGKKNENK
jgi:ABC-type phosphate/phosphonate transport system substrate-binding protein